MAEPGNFKEQATAREIDRVATVIESEVSKSLDSKSGNDVVASLERIGDEVNMLQHDPELMKAVAEKINKDCDKSNTIDADLVKNEKGEVRYIVFTPKPAEGTPADKAGAPTREIEIPWKQSPNRPRFKD
ncbi:MAG: hypothetical protein K2W82_14645 [Candidatus Obscuribacterales bacterium]|nr:hypothetical protein [Candidatus Obscuribacterales bacterium]